MRFKEFAEATTPIGPNASWVQNGASGHTVFTEPWDAEKEKRNSEGVYLQQYKIDNGKLPAEIAQLKGPDGLYNVNAVTGSLIDKLMQKYPDSGSPFWGFSYKATQPADYYKEADRVQAELKKALATANEFAAPKSRFYWPNRPLPDDAIGGYKGDGSTGRVENVAKKFDPSDLKFYMSAIKWAVQHRFLDPMPPEQWLMILLTEGRDDFGFNIGQWNSQKSKTYADLEERLKAAGMTNSYQIGFVALTKSKMDKVKGNGMSFYQAWNGGAANLANYNAQAAAIKDPRNKPLLDIITAALA